MAIDPRQLRQALFCISFSNSTATTLVQQARDCAALQKDDGEHRDDLPAISVPSRELSKQDFTARGKSALADVPALKLSPIVSRCREFSRRNLDTACSLA